MQMFQFWRCLTDRMTHHVGRTMADRSLFREQSYHTLKSQGVARRADLGTYRASSRLA